MINKFKKISLALTITISLVSIAPQTTYANQNLSNEQINIPSNWAKSEIDNAKKVNLVPESIEGNYRKGITREEFSELAINLYEVLTKQEVTVQGNNPFVDTKNPKVIIANQLGIIKGKGERLFDPYEKITREQASMVIYNTLTRAKPKYNYGDSNNSGFKDATKISSWAREAVDYLYGIEVINGSDENLFDPKGDTSREEAIILVKRLYNKVVESERASRNQITASRSGVRSQDDSKQSKLKELISKELGKPYKWGAAGPNSYDCSGLTYSLFGKLGIKLERSSKGQINSGTHVEKSDLQYGDLVLFARDGKNINHVGIYVGDGKFVHSPQTGDVVKTTTLMSGYYSSSYYTARRVF
jgi:hypothetical protein